MVFAILPKLGRSGTGRARRAPLNGFGVNTVATIQRFDEVTGRFETCTWNQGGQAAGDFPVVSGTGYLVHALANVTIALAGCGD
jgi:hypothetical protein